MIKIKTQDGKVITALSFHFDGRTGKVYAYKGDTHELRMENFVVCGTYNQARALEVFNDIVSKCQENRKTDTDEPVYIMPES